MRSWQYSAEGVAAAAAAVVVAVVAVVGAVIGVVGVVAAERCTFQPAAAKPAIQHDLAQTQGMIFLFHVAAPPSRLLPAGAAAAVAAAAASVDVATDD